VLKSPSRLVWHSMLSYLPVCFTQDLLFQSFGHQYSHVFWSVYLLGYLLIYLFFGFFLFKEKVSLQNCLLGIGFYVLYFLLNSAFVFLNPWAYKLYPMVHY
jgi:hypothetical protein